MNSQSINHPFYSLYQIQDRAEELINDAKEILTSGSSPELKEKMKRESQCFDRYQVDDFCCDVENETITTLYYKEEWEESKEDLSTFDEFIEWLSSANESYVESYRYHGRVLRVVLMKDVRTSTVQEFINYKMNGGR